MRGLLYLGDAFLPPLSHVCMVSLCTTDHHKYFLVVALELLRWFMLSGGSPMDRLYVLSGFPRLFLSFLFCTLVICHLDIACSFSSDAWPLWWNHWPWVKHCPNSTRWEVQSPPAGGRDCLDPPASAPVGQVPPPRKTKPCAAQCSTRTDSPGQKGEVPICEFVISK